MSIVIGIVIAILVFGVVVLIHELGHFWAARKVGILVEEFSIGMGPRLFSFKPGETRYSLKAFPLGGSCRMLGETDEDDEEGKSAEEIRELKSRSFLNKPVKSRMFVILAGVVMNLLLAVIFSTLYSFNTDFAVPEVSGFVVQIDSVIEGSPAYEAGLRAGDRIVAVNNEPTLYQNQFWRQIDEPWRQQVYQPVITIEIGRVVDNQWVRGIVEVESDIPNIGVTLNAESPAQLAGLQPGDRITHINGSRVRTQDDFWLYMRFRADGSPLTITFTRNGERLRTVIEEPYFVEGAQSYRIGFLAGGRLAFFTRRTDENSMHQRASFSESVSNGIFGVSFYVRSTLLGLSQLVTRQIGMDEMGGPVMIASVISDTTDVSFEHGGVMAVVWNAVRWMTIISSNLFVFNLLPIPALDGGKMVFLTIEAIRGKPISIEKEGIIHLVGFVLLMAFAVFVMYNDIVRVIIR